LVTKSDKPTFLLLNKIDLMKDKSRLLPLIERYSQKAEFAEVIPLSQRFYMTDIVCAAQAQVMALAALQTPCLPQS